MARTTPASSGCTSLVRPLGMILPGATATMSTVPRDAHAAAAQKTRTMVKAMALPIGEGGVSTTSRAAGRKASSSRRRLARGFASVDGMLTCLQAVERGVAALRLDQLLVRALLDEPTFIDRQHTVGDPES